MSALRCAFLCLGLAVVNGCTGHIEPTGHVGGTSGVCTPDLASLETKVFTSCTGASCHNTMDKAAGLDLDGPDVENQLVGAAAGTCGGWSLVVPGSPDQSLLYTKVAGQPPCGAAMPVGSRLPDAQIACVRGWIASLGGGGIDSGGAIDSGGGSDGCPTCGGATCVDVGTDPANCGACGRACPAGVACANGTCACANGQTACGATCVDTQTSPSHCGDCAISCDPGSSCSGGNCSCAASLVACGGKCVDVAQDPGNCGGCGNVCAPGQSCSAGSCTCGTVSVSFSGAVQPIFTASCANNGCHGGMVAQQGLNLSSGKSYASLVNVAASECSDGRKRVAPGSPSTSYLVQKMTAVNMCSGSQMPKAGQGLAVGQTQTIANWICNGAPNN